MNQINEKTLLLGVVAGIALAIGLSIGYLIFNTAEKEL